MRTIAYIDDENGNCIIFKKFLSKFAAVETFDDPLQAVSILKEKKFDVIVTDYKMDALTGLDLLGEIQGINDSTIKFVLTGYPDDEIFQNAVRDGIADQVFFKPFDRARFLKVLEKHESQRGIKHESIDPAKNQPISSTHISDKMTDDHKAEKYRKLVKLYAELDVMKDLVTEKTADLNDQTSDLGTYLGISGKEFEAFRSYLTYCLAKGVDYETLRNAMAVLNNK